MIEHFLSLELFSTVGVLLTGLAILAIVLFAMGVGPFRLAKVISSVPELAAREVPPEVLADKWYPAKHGLTKGVIKLVLIFGGLAIFVSLFDKVVTPNVDYRDFPFIASRVALWIAAQIHLLFSGFVLGVPVFAVIFEFVGHFSKNERYDRLAHEFAKLLSLALTVTALAGAVLFLFLFFLYPGFFAYMSKIFKPTYYVYVALIAGEVTTVALWYYSWDAMKDRKVLHGMIGVLSNVVGTLLMCWANSWATFMMTPSGVNESGDFLGSLWAAIHNPAWMPVNIHRLIANVVFGGAVVGAYAAYRFLGAETDEERAHYDWMGYTGNFIAVLSLIPLPFAGYWLGFEIYQYSTTMGMEMMGGTFSWMFIIQALLIGAIFMTANFYLWMGMGRIPGSERYRPYTWLLLAVLTACFMVWGTPHTLIVSQDEALRLGGTHQKLLAPLGVMSAKNTAVNTMILTTFVSFLIYRRANKVATVSWAKAGQFIQWTILAVAWVAVLYIGVKGYSVPSNVRVMTLSPMQVGIVIVTMILSMAIDIPLFKGARSLGEIQWGKMPARSQYALIFLALSFTWLMGLMGYIRSGLRLHWHIWGILKDRSADAFTPAFGYAAWVISTCVTTFWLLVCLVIWMGTRGEKAHATH